MLPFCMWSGMGFRFSRSRGVSLVLGLGIMMVGWMISLVIFILVAWFRSILFIREVLWLFEVL